MNTEKKYITHREKLERKQKLGWYQFEEEDHAMDQNYSNEGNLQSSRKPDLDYYDTNDD